ncbi:MAG TPA: chromosomal replication initiator protein DnaA [Candidatus Saccharimonadales bacterium]|nr:chromosomal replication initiator protein DnaA [Candidatus Saccharimonadales bacterium]
MNIWQQILDHVEHEIPAQAFATWLRPTTLLRDDGRVVYISVPNRLFSDWIRRNYADRISAAALDADRPELDVRFVCEGEDTAVDVAPAPASDRRSSEPDGVNPRYTFESFVVSSSNEFAHAAALRVADAPGKAYNPLFIYGGVGLGKTHLMHAIGNRVRGKKTERRLKYISSETFLNELIGSIQFENTSEFRGRYRNIDILLVDDIQFLAGKERTQEEFFHTFNALYEAGKQIVMTSDSRPRDIPTLEERLRSRFEWGLIADIQPPDLETKVAILNKKAEAEGVELSSDVAIFIASKTKSNVRELEGALVRLLAFASVTGRRIDLALTRDVLKDIFPDHDRAITVDAIQKYVADYYHLRVADLKAKNNARQISFPRQIAMYLCKNLTSASLPEIGRRFGNKHHSTVLHAVRKIERLRKDEHDFDRIVNSFIEAFK